MNKLTIEMVNNEIVKRDEERKKQLEQQNYITYSNMYNAFKLVKTGAKIYYYLSSAWTIGKIVTLII